MYLNTFNEKHCPNDVIHIKIGNLEYIGLFKMYAAGRPQEKTRLSRACHTRGIQV